MATNTMTKQNIGKITVTTNNQRELMNRAMRAILSSSNSGWPVTVKRLEQRISHLVLNAIQNSPTYKALMLRTSHLSTHLGLLDGISKLDTIINIIDQNMKVEFTTITGKQKLRGKIRIRMVQSDFLDIVRSPAGRQITEVGEVLDWLDWLLYRGDNVIIADFDVITSSYLGRDVGRTGGGIMVKNFNRGRWSVPSEHSGIQTDNFITRAIDSVSNRIQQVIEEELELWAQS
jgi:hypothetical protein